jgi:hypothetical protein
MTRIVSHQDLSTSDLIVDAIYEGGVGLPGEPLSKVMPGVGNLGGFRAAGKGKDKKFVVLYTSGEDKDWPDSLDLSTGQFVYYGDNKSPGHELHDTQPGGNAILRRVFELLHSSFSGSIRRRRVPDPFSSKGWPYRDFQDCHPRRIWLPCGRPPKASGFRTIARYSPFSMFPSLRACG